MFVLKANVNENHLFLDSQENYRIQIDLPRRLLDGFKKIRQQQQLTGNDELIARF